ncbi:MAG: UDP-N-acetylmuramate:L-alanyl-gamma-D-glutamyl-meso-diaminopimelate ligase, partial [Proteobacteria bacterium]|nr:UDP-N-acetylmuramate:L-alanyl-gamma-D-glutamyl-meso-diaminopimelate ligase [Pseudomonadota bacterium]
IVVGNAVTKDNPEINKMNELGLNFCSMPQAINRFVADGKKTILITGTHGKTTTSSIMAWILYVAGLDPSFIIGGILKNFNSNYRLGKGKFIVIEGDEYDTAYFDKGPKFLHYDPYMAVITSIEFDHADIFKDIDHVKKAFDIFLSGISQDSTIVAFDGDKNIDGLISASKCRVIKYGKDTSSAWSFGKVSYEPPWTFFEILKQDKIFKTFKTRIFGEHNLLNTLAAVAIADKLMIPNEVIAKALESFQGVKRRQEIRGQKRGITVMDDFAHHPTAVKETVRAVKSFYQNKRLIAVFEPRTNTSMRNIFQNIYPLSFDHADIICIRKPPLLNKIPPDEQFSSEKLVNDLQNTGKDAHYFPDTESIIKYLEKTARPGDFVLIMSNGGFDNIHDNLLKRL